MVSSSRLVADSAAYRQSRGHAGAEFEATVEVRPRNLRHDHACRRNFGVSLCPFVTLLKAGEGPRAATGPVRENSQSRRHAYYSRRHRKYARRPASHTSRDALKNGAASERAKPKKGLAPRESGLPSITSASRAESITLDSEVSVFSMRFAAASSKLPGGASPIRITPSNEDDMMIA